METNQTSILKNQYMIMNILCELSATSGISIDDHLYQ